MGTLLEGQRDASGQMYMRNRMYDPQTGQFTQTDPIGIARHGHNVTQLEAEYYVGDIGTGIVALFVVRRASAFANRMAERFPTTAGAANAGRHQFGQCLMTQLVGEEIAQTTADLHEAGATDQEDSQRDQAMMSLVSG